MVVPCDNPSPPTWDTFRKNVDHLMKYSCLMDFDPAWANKELALYFLGAYSKLVRSLYMKNPFLLDLVMKDSLAPEEFFGLSGMKVAHKVPVKVTITKAEDRIPLDLLKDYASYLTWGKCYNGPWTLTFFIPTRTGNPLFGWYQ